MVTYNLSKLAQIVSGELVGDGTALIHNIAFDTRNIVHPQYSLFIAFKGIQQDGHTYLRNAYDKGIRNFMVEKIPTQFQEANYIIVSDTKRALQNWAKSHIADMGVPIVGITGSNGKTIVKEWLHQLLIHELRVVRSPKSFNSQIGVPLSVLEIQEHDDLAIIEFGISQPGEMHFLADMVMPEIGVLTNVGTAHSAFFLDRNQHIEEKLRLFKDAKTIIYPYDDEEIRLAVKDKFNHKKCIGFGRSREADICLISSSQIEEQIRFEDEVYHVSIPAHDEASIQNVLICFATLTQLGINLSRVILNFTKLSAIEMRLEIKDGDCDTVIINDTFNSDLSSIPIALNVLNQQKKSNKTLILTDILQNRMRGEELYGQLADWVNAYPIHKVYLIGEEISAFKNKFNAVISTYPSTQSFLDQVHVQDVCGDAILLKGARKFELEKISKKWEKKSHDTILEVNLEHLTDNVNFYKSKLSADTKIMCMVKAFGYGTGGFEVAQALTALHVDYLGVAYADEGAELRKRGITTPIMVMNPEQSSYDTIVDEKLEAEIYSLRVLEKFTLKLIEKRISQAFPIHIKLNSGMNRLGFKENEIEALIRELRNNPYVKVVSIFSHLATSDIPAESDFVHQQVQRFLTMYEALCEGLEYRPLRHILNSAGISNYPEYQMDMVRLGIGMYGVSTNPQDEKYLKNVVVFKTVISQITLLEEGETVSYGRKFMAEHPMRIATLPVGYADGVKRCLGNQVGKVAIHGHIAPILGVVCMDMIMVDVTHIACEEGDEVIIFGDKPTLSEVAKDAHTITYEILTSISSRVKRIYLQ